MKKLCFIIAGCCLLFSLLSSPIHFFNLPQDDKEFSFFSDNNKEVDDQDVAEDKESEQINNEQYEDQVASYESESWFFSRFSMLNDSDDESNW